jgi:4-amino-4-deoxy-L-arabinose transferase-like glycosyltransferase
MARALILLAVLTAVRLLVAAVTPLSPDEAYYWVWSKALAPGFLDHPPMVALWIRAGTALLGDGALGIRLLGPLSAALGTVLLARAAEDLFPGRRLGVPAAVLLNATLLLGAGAVTMTPDTPLLFFWTATLWALAQLLRTGRAWWWIVAGLAAGGALDSKYTAALLGLGMALWLIADPAGRRWLRTPWPWAGGVLAVLIFTPVLAWNAAHGWASFAKQGGRTGDWHPADALRYLGELIGSQLGLGTPLVAILCAAGVWASVRRFREGGAATLLACLTVPGVAVFLEHALGDRVQANWPAILFPAAVIAAAAYAPRYWRPAAALGFAITAVVYLQAATAILPLPRKLDPTLIRLGGWDGLAAEVARQATQAPAAFIAADNYGVAAILAHALPGPVVGAEPRWALFNLPQIDLAGQSGLLVRSHRRHGGPDPAPFLSVQPAGTVLRSRGGVVAEEYDLYRVVMRGSMVRLPAREGD